MTPDEIRTGLKEKVHLSDWQLLRRVLELIKGQSPDPHSPSPAAQNPEQLINSWSALAKRVKLNRRSFQISFDRITGLFRGVAGRDQPELIKTDWTLSRHGERVLRAAVIVLDRGLEGAIDFLVSGHTEPSGRLVVSAAEAVSTYLLPFLEPPPEPYRLLPWSPYMTSLAACDLLHERRADLVITWADEAEPPRGITKAVFQGERRVRVILHQSHPLAEKYAATADAEAEGLPVDALRGATFAVPNDTHLASSCHQLVNHLGGDVLTCNVGRFPQAITHVQLTGAFSLFPDWPWCLPALRRSNGIVALLPVGVPFQPVRLQAMWRTRDGEHKALSDLRGKILGTYKTLVGPPTWRMTAGVGAGTTAGESVSYAYFLSHPSDVLPSVGKWQKATVCWGPSDVTRVSGGWKPAEDKPESCRVTLSAASGGAASIEFGGEAGFRLSGLGVLSFTARRRADRASHHDVLAGRITLLAGGRLASGPVFVSPVQLNESDLRALRQLLDDSSFTS